jgi:arylsulfatase A-like enzyme
VRAFLHTPLAAIVPPTRAGTSTSALFHCIDIFPTTLAMVGIDPAAVNKSSGPAGVPMDGINQVCV